MPKVLIEIPEHIIQNVKIPPSEVNERLKQELAVHLYEQGMLTFGKARELAGISKWEFHDLLGKNSIIRRYDQEDLDKDMESLRSLR